MASGFDDLLNLYTAFEPTPSQPVIERIGVSGRAATAQRRWDCDNPLVIPGPAVQAYLTSFSLFPALPAELRIQIWRTALDMQEPRVVNIFVKCHNPTRELNLPSRLTLLNNEHLRRTDTIGTLLRVSYESRIVARDYLTTHPNIEARAAFNWRYGNKRKMWKSLYRLGYHFLDLHIHPRHDILFLNGLDLEPTPAPTVHDAIPRYDFQTPQRTYQPPAPSSRLAFPSSFRDDHIVHIGQSFHTRRLGEHEEALTHRFHTIIMPVHGLVDHFASGEGLFDDPLYPPYDLGPRYPFGDMRCRTFIAVVGGGGEDGGRGYRGRNLQLRDLELLEEAEVAEARREAWEASVGWRTDTRMHWMRACECTRRVARSVLHRDVLVMSVVWEKWAQRTRNGYGYPDDAVTETAERPRLVFARVKEGVLRAVEEEGNLYFGEDERVEY